MLVQCQVIREARIFRRRARWPGKPTGLLAALLAALLATTNVPAGAQPPSSFAPLPAAPKINADRAELGRMLFFDNRLSGDTGNSCASCHNPAKGWGDGKALSDGYAGVLYFRNAPGLFNVANRAYLMWDGRLDGADLGTLVRDMLTEAHTMNMDSRLAQERLKQVPAYAALFEKGFKGDPYGGKIYGAIAEYIKTIRTVNAPFDRYLQGDKGALTSEQVAGMQIFAGKANCVACHGGPMLSDGKMHVLNVPENPEIAGNADRQISMLRHFSTMGTPNYMNQRTDVGHYVVTKEKRDIGKFVTPSLWDVGQTAPYMHNGVFATLEQVIDFYDAGGGGKRNRDPLLKPLKLSADEKVALVAFVKSFAGDAPKETPPALPEYKIRTIGQN